MILVLILVGILRRRPQRRRARAEEHRLTWRRSSACRNPGRARPACCSPGAGGSISVVGFVFLLLPIVTLVVFSFQRNQYASIPGRAGRCAGTKAARRRYAARCAEEQPDRLAAGRHRRLRASASSPPMRCNRFVFPGRTLLAVVIVLPMLVPPLILGIALSRPAVRASACRASCYSVLITHIVLTTAPAMAIIQLRLWQMPRLARGGGLESRRDRVAGAAAGGAAVRDERHRRRLAARLHLLLRRVRDLLVRLRLRPTLPVTIYAYLVGSADPSLNAIASIIFVLSGLVLLGRRAAADPDADPRLRAGAARGSGRVKDRPYSWLASQVAISSKPSQTVSRLSDHTTPHAAHCGSKYSLWTLAQ